MAFSGMHETTRYCNLPSVLLPFTLYLLAALPTLFSSQSSFENTPIHRERLLLPMAQQHTMPEGVRQLQQDIKRPATPSRNHDPSPTSQRNADTLSEYHPLGCRCPKHRLSDHALAEAFRVSHRRTNKEAVKQQQVELAQAVHRGLEKLGVELSNSEADRIATNNTGMVLMERFLEETCDYKYFARANANAGGEDAELNEGQKE